MRWLVLFVVLCSVPTLNAEQEKQKSPEVKQERLIDRLCIVQMHKEAMKRRKERRLERQKLNEECCRIAQRWAEDMAKRNRLEHGGGEQVIARGYKTPVACVAAWMLSAPHRAWWLCKRSRVGWGCATSKTGVKYWAGCFRK